MGLKIGESTFSHSEELGNVLLWDIVEDKSINGSKRQLVKFMERSALWMWWFVYSHQLCITQSRILKLQQREILSFVRSVSHALPWRLRGWSGQAPALALTFPAL